MSEGEIKRRNNQKNAIQEDTNEKEAFLSLLLAIAPPTVLLGLRPEAGKLFLVAHHLGNFLTSTPSALLALILALKLLPPRFLLTSLLLFLPLL